jgi:amylosucrase
VHAVAFAHGGLPLIYMGDELGLSNDADWDADPAHRGDNRWMHRPAMDWAAAERRHRAGTVEERLWNGLRRLATARAASRAVHAQGASVPLWTGNDHVFGLLREHAGARLLLLASFGADPQAIPARIVREHGCEPRPEAAEPDGRPLELRGDELVLAPYQHLWLRP